MTNWTESECPKCGRPERHDSRKILAKCSICLMREADAVDQEELRAQAFLNVHETVLSICRKHNLSQRDLAFVLKIRPDSLTSIKRGEKPFPEHSFEIMKEKYTDCFVEKAQ